MNKLLAIIAILSLVAGDCYARGGFSGGSRGGFSSGRSFSSPSRSYSSPSRTVTRTTTINRSYGGRSYYGGYGYHPMYYGGFGMGYGYSNGLIEGLIIGNMMHPTGTTLYNGGGYNGQALLYPDGRVVDQSGYQVGMYQNGQFSAVQGGMVAQPVPVGATPPQQVIVQDDIWEFWSSLAVAIIAIVLIIFIICIIVD